MGRSGISGWVRHLFALVLIGLPFLVGSAHASTKDDAMVIFCLAPAQRADVRDAIIALELAQPAELSDLAAWRKRQPDQFDTACTGLYNSRKAPVTTDFATVLPFLTGFAGALFGFAGAAWRDRVTRGREIGDKLRAAVTEFHEAGEEYLRGVTPGSPDKELLAARRRLIDQLAGVQATHPKWQRVAGLVGVLTAGPLGSAMSQGWKPSPTKESAERERDLGKALARLRDDVLAVAAHLTVDRKSVV